LPRMEDKSKFRCGFVTLFGRPNVGKSTLVNALVGEKVSIVSPVPQTTRYLVRAILNLPQAQVVFVDVPGFHLFRHKLCHYLNQAARQALEGIDAVVYVVDVSRMPQREERAIVKILLQQDAPLIMALNKIDLSKRYLSDYLELWRELAQDKYPLVKYFIPISARRGDNLAALQEALVEILPPQQAYYPTPDRVDFPLELRIADIIREAFFQRLAKEVPHDLAVYVDEISSQNDRIYIRAVVYVNRASQKAIVLGKKGNLIKEVGIRSRPQIEKILAKKVFLDLKVKILARWSSNLRILRQLGLNI